MTGNFRKRKTRVSQRSRHVHPLSWREIAESLTERSSYTDKPKLPNRKQSRSARKVGLLEGSRGASDQLGAHGNDNFSARQQPRDRSRRKLLP
jgi:hypothetical protein